MFFSYEIEYIVYLNDENKSLWIILDKTVYFLSFLFFFKKQYLPINERFM